MPTTTPIDLTTAPYIEIANYLYDLPHTDLVHALAVAIYTTQPAKRASKAMQYTRGLDDAYKIVADLVRRSLESHR